MATIVTDISNRIPWLAARGTHNRFVISFTENGSAYDISDLTFALNIKVNGEYSDNALQLTEGSGITNNGELGTLEIDLTKSQINNLKRERYYYEIVYVKDSLTYALIRDSLTIQIKNASSYSSLDVTVNLGGVSVAAAVSLIDYSAIVQVAEVTITSAEILNSFTTPIEIIPAPGPGKVILPFHFFAKLNFNTTPYATNIFYRFKFGSINHPVGGDLDWSGSSNTWYILGVNSLTTTTDIENTALVIQTQSGNPTSGDSTMTIRALYKVLDI